MKRSLLIISCSDAKTDDPGAVPAIQRYKGPFFPSIRKAMREGYFPESLDILILSAKYGIIRHDENIEDYDQRMSPERAGKLRPSVQKKLDNFFKGHGLRSTFQWSMGRRQRDTQRL